MTRERTTSGKRSADRRPKKRSPGAKPRARRELPASRRQCVFCDLTEAETDGQRLVGGPKLFVCTACLALCAEVFEEPATQKVVADLVCSFCGRDHRHRLLAGPVVYVCDECVDRLGSV